MYTLYKKFIWIKNISEKRILLKLCSKDFKINNPLESVIIAWEYLNAILICI